MNKSFLLWLISGKMLNLWFSQNMMFNMVMLQYTYTTAKRIIAWYANLNHQWCLTYRQKMIQNEWNEQRNTWLLFSVELGSSILNEKIMMKFSIFMTKFLAWFLKRELVFGYMEIGSIMLNDSTKEIGQKVSVTIGKLIHVIKIWLDNEYITDLTPIKYFTTIHYKYQGTMILSWDVIIDMNQFFIK